MSRIDSLMARLLELESSGGYVTLQDGTKFRLKNSGIRMLLNATKLGRDLGRELMLSDIPVEEQEQWRCYAKWSPDPAKHGQISGLLVGMAKKISGERSFRPALTGWQTSALSPLQHAPGHRRGLHPR